MCPPEMDIAVERDQATGELLAYHEVRMHTCIYIYIPDMEDLCAGSKAVRRCTWILCGRSQGIEGTVQTSCKLEGSRVAYEGTVTWNAVIASDML